MIICLSGMHRSGTSLMASYFKACGIPMGDDLKVASIGNNHGHFEDMEFLTFHKDVIRRLGVNMYSPSKPVQFNQAELEQARNMLEDRNSRYETWGWKEPRTTLFLGDWQSLDENIRYVFMYRNPEQVIRSLFKRKDRWLYTRPWLAPAAWLYHNEKVLDFYNKHKENSVLVGINGFNTGPEPSEKALSEWLGLPFDKPYSTVYQPKSISKEGEGALPFPFNFFYPKVFQHYQQRLEDVYARLNESALVPDHQ